MIPAPTLSDQLNLLGRLLTEATKTPNADFVAVCRQAAKAVRSMATDAHLLEIEAADKALERRNALLAKSPRHPGTAADAMGSVVVQFKPKPGIAARQDAGWPTPGGAA